MIGGGYKASIYNDTYWYDRVQLQHLSREPKTCLHLGCLRYSSSSLNSYRICPSDSPNLGPIPWRPPNSTTPQHLSQGMPPTIWRRWRLGQPSAEPSKYIKMMRPSQPNHRWPQDHPHEIETSNEISKWKFGPESLTLTPSKVPGPCWIQRCRLSPSERDWTGRGPKPCRTGRPSEVGCGMISSG